MQRIAFLGVLSLVVAACGSSGGGGAPDAGDGPDGASGGDCGGQSCEADQMCHADQCVAECPDVADLCGAASEACCNSAQACIFDECVELGESCTFTEDCEEDEICEQTLGQCIPRDSVPACEFVPPPGVFSPAVDCQWQPGAGAAFPAYDDVVMTPSVANLTDDNGDGITDRRDIPDVVFVSFDRQGDGCCTNRGVIRIVSGACNPDGSMTTIATLGNANPYIGNSSGIALANLHQDTDTAESAPEIVATLKGGGAVAYRRTAADGSSWEQLWLNTSAPSGAHSPQGAQPSIADLDADGLPEIIIGNVVLNGLTGVVIWDGKVTVGASAGVGNNAFLGPSSTVADLDLDGELEVIAGNTVYSANGAEKWTYDYTGSNSSCGGSVACDGFNAIGNFDGDDEGEVVIVRLGEVFVLNHDGTLLHQVAIPIDDCGFNESGPPTVADFDGDGRAEIGTASADFYVVIDFDCTAGNLAGCDSENVLWKVANQDCSSRATGSSVFDFDGDGNAEVVYADEVSFRIFAGADGTVLFEDATHRSNTRMEMPIVVDVDNDGKSEVIVPEPNTSSTSLGGIEVWQDTDNNWVRTRRIWNQHGYHVTNVTEDGQVPRNPDANWRESRLNNFRQNVQPAGLFDAPDLVTAMALPECAAGIATTASIEVRNEGALAVAAGIDVFVQVFDGDDALVTSGIVSTTGAIAPGGSEIVTFDIASPPQTMRVTALVDDDGAGNQQYNECDEANNGSSQTISCDRIE